MQQIAGGVCAPNGFLASGIHCGIRKNPQKKDLALIYSIVPCTAAGVTTQNQMAAAPVQLTRSHLMGQHAQAIICNSGNANACTSNGMQIATQMCELTAGQLSIPLQDVLVCSTGVIGQQMEIEPIREHIRHLVHTLCPSGSQHSAEAIMTTDLTKKEIAVSFEVGGTTCKMGGIAKGSGMIHPNMATMLAFITTDAAISETLLQHMLAEVVDDTFHMISVDGDTSTNDTCLILANGTSGNSLISEKNADYEQIKQTLLFVCTYLAKAIAADGEGATKLLECCVIGANDTLQAKKLAKTVICSDLLKAAMYGEDANWGRIICALGYAEVPLDSSKISIALASQKGTLLVCKEGMGVAFSEEEAQRILHCPQITIEIRVGTGKGKATAWGCDLTYDYVKINGDYRS